MRLPHARPWLIVCGALIVAFGAACSSSSGDGSDLAARSGTSGGASVVVPAPEGVPFWQVPILDADDDLARFDGTLNGIHLGPDIDRMGDRGSPCETASGGPISLEEAAQSELNVIPSSLPERAELGEWHAVRCGGLVASVDVSYFVPADLERGFRGGMLLVYRRRGDFAFRGFYPAERVQPVTLAGRPGIEVVPVLPDGLGSSAIILREDWGLTIVRAEGFTSDALREIVLSLYDRAVAGGLPVLDGDACDPTRSPLAVAPDDSGFLALSQGFILSRYDADGCHVDDLVLGINIGTAFDVAWSPAGDR